MECDEMVVIAARPSHGKSAFALQALDAAAYCEIPCGIVSEEMSALGLGKRPVQYVRCNTYRSSSASASGKG